MTHFPTVFLVFQHSLLDILHRLIDTLMVFFWCQKFKVLLSRNLQIHTEAIGIASCLIYQLLTGSRNAFQVDVAIEAMYFAQILGNPYQAFHRIVRIPNYPRT